MSRIGLFVREPLRAPFTVVSLIGIPALFVVSAAGVLSEFASALGGSLADDAAVALSAGWAAAFVAGTLGFFTAASSRSADRRLALAGLGAVRLAASRLASSSALAMIAAAAAFAALEARSPVAHPAHAAVGLLGYALLYVAIGVLVGSIVAAPLEGSLIVTFVFLLDVFAGPGMSDSPPPWAISRDAGRVLIAAGRGSSSGLADWLSLALVVITALTLSFATFVAIARSRR